VELGKQSLMASEKRWVLMATAGGSMRSEVPRERGSEVWEGEMNAGQRRGLGHGSKGARHGGECGRVGSGARGCALDPCIEREREQLDGGMG